jgi:hypothetical protein
MLWSIHNTYLTKGKCGINAKWYEAVLEWSVWSGVFGVCWSVGVGVECVGVGVECVGVECWSEVLVEWSVLEWSMLELSV